MRLSNKHGCQGSFFDYRYHITNLCFDRCYGDGCNGSKSET